MRVAQTPGHRECSISTSLQLTLSAGDRQGKLYDKAQHRTVVALYDTIILIIVYE